MNKSSQLRGADLLLRALQTAAVPRLYTLSGNHVMSVFDAALSVGMPLIHTRHEASAVHMADAQARLTGQVGVALVTGGPGHANAVSALYTALMAESPVLLLSGHAPTSQVGKGAFQEMRQAEMAAPVCKASFTCSHVDELVADVARAVRTALSGRPGPVHLSLPSDVLEAQTAMAPLGREAFAPATMPLSAKTASTVVQRLAQAQRPLVLTGPASLTRQGRARLAQLQNALGVPVLGMQSPRGIADGSLGAFAPALAEADCVLLLGKRLDFTLRFGRAPAFPATAAVLQIDADGQELQRSQHALGTGWVLSAEADVFSAIEALTVAASQAEAGLPQRTAWAWFEDVEALCKLRPASWANAKSERLNRLHPVQMLAPLQNILDSHPDAVLVADGGEIGQWATACLNAPHRLINGVAGSIGGGLPFALAARCALPDAPVVAVMGDGTVGFHIAEFDTAVRYRLPLLAVVGNDARWNAEYQIQLRDYGAARLVGCELLPTRYDQVAQAFGGHSECVNQPADMVPALQRAQASGLPSCINVMIEGLPAPVIKAP